MAVDKDQYILKFPKDDYEPNAKGLGFELYYCMKLNANKVAQFIVETNEVDTYGSLLQKSIRTAIKLQQLNLNENDVISLCSHNHKNTVVPVIATAFAGLIFSPLDPLLGEEQTSYLLNITKPKIIFATLETADLLEKVLKQLNFETKLVIFGKTDKYEEFSSYLEPQNGEDTFEPRPAKSLKDTTLIYFSSGSTGLPKGVCVNHYGIMVQSVNMLKADKLGTTLNLSNYTCKMGDESVVWATSSFYWISAYLYLLECIFSGVPKLIHSQFNPETFWSIIDKYQVTHMFWSAVIILKLSDMCKNLAPQKTSLRCVLMGGAKISDEIFKRLRKTYPTMYLRSGYGMTEASGPICCKTYNPMSFDVDPSNYGKPRGEIQIKIVDPASGKILPPTQPGELRIKSPFLMNGYYKMDPKGVYDEDGFFCTGDIVRFDENNNLYYVERLKELIKYRGYHVSPVIIENVLETIPDVERAAVLGVFNEIDAEHPKAFVQLKKSSKISVEDIQLFVDEKVDNLHKLRGGVQIVDSLPMTPSDKINRAALRKLYISKS